MMPFPETEVMTIKRLEVAIKKMDLKLLKDGAYKLHEKYHSGHIFEYIDSLKAISNEVSNSVEIPNDIKNFLLPTIDDILLKQQKIENFEKTQNSYTNINNNNENSLAINQYQQNVSIPNDFVKNETNNININPIQTTNNENINKINAFDAFNAPKKQNNNLNTSLEQEPILNTKPTLINTSSNILNNSSNSNPNPVLKPEEPKTFFTHQSPFSAQPFKEINPTRSSDGFQFQEPTKPQEPVFEAPKETESTTVTLEDNLQSPPSTFENIEEINEVNNIEEIEEKTKTVSILYCEDFSREKSKNIRKYKNLISNNFENAPLETVINLISEINTQTNNTIVEIKNILNQLKTTKHKINIITNSNSVSLIGLLKQEGIEYSLFDNNEEKQVNVLPILGLSNLFKCTQCDELLLDEVEEMTPFVIQCPKCKGAMLPDFYTYSNNNSQINLQNYNKSLVALTNSNTWFMVHPNLDDELIYELISNASKISSTLEEVFILAKDINKKEDVKQLILNSQNEVKINTNVSAVQEFLETI